MTLATARPNRAPLLAAFHRAIRSPSAALVPEGHQAASQAARVEALRAVPFTTAGDAIGQIVGERVRGMVVDFEPAAIIPDHGRNAARGGKIRVHFLVPLTNVVAVELLVATAPTDAPLADEDGHAAPD